MERLFKTEKASIAQRLVDSETNARVAMWDAIQKGDEQAYDAWQSVRRNFVPLTDLAGLVYGMERSVMESDRQFGLAQTSMVLDFVTSLMGFGVQMYGINNQPKPSDKVGVGGGYGEFASFSVSCVDGTQFVCTILGPVALKDVAEWDLVMGDDGKFHRVIGKEYGFVPVGQREEMVSSRS